jgi:hypothetical protein
MAASASSPPIAGSPSPTADLGVIVHERHRADFTLTMAALAVFLQNRQDILVKCRRGGQAADPAPQTQSAASVRVHVITMPVIPPPKPTPNLPV